MKFEGVADYAGITKQLVQEVNDNTVYVMKGRSGLPLSLIGEDSKFLRAIDNKVKKLGYQRGDHSQGGFRRCSEFAAYIVDTETTPGWDLSQLRPGVNDIDLCVSTRSYDTSCDAKAAGMIVEKLARDHKYHVGIIGRGHAVLGLQSWLIRHDHTVTQCHSKTQHIIDILSMCDVIVSATSVNIFPSDFDFASHVILDIGYAIPREYGNGTIIHNVGMLTTSIIVNRAAHVFVSPNIMTDKTQSVPY